MWLEATMAIGGLLLPPIVNFVKQKFLKGSGDVPTTIATLATTKPDQLAPYIEAYAKYLNAETAFYNRDVIGNIGAWVASLRAAIRPLGVIFSFVALVADAWYGLGLSEVVRGTFEMVIGTWFGSRILSK